MQNIPPSDRIGLSVKEAAAAAGLSAATINRRIRDKTLPSSKVVGRRIITPQNLRAMIESGREG
jgi:excisionase family DNA binding protein